MSDWWGFANALAMIWSIGVRHYVLEQNRKGLDIAVVQAGEQCRDCTSDLVKLFITTSNSKAVTMFAPESIVRSCFVKRPSPPHKAFYALVRHLGWVAFAIHIISIGQAGLICQIYTVVLMVLPTVLMVYKIGCDDGQLGSRLRATKSEYPENTLEATRRTDVYVMLDLDAGEEDSLKKWMLMPHERNVSWWEVYRRKKTEWQASKDQHLSDGGTYASRPSKSATEKILQSIPSTV